VLRLHRAAADVVAEAGGHQRLRQLLDGAAPQGAAVQERPCAAHRGPQLVLGGVEHDAHERRPVDLDTDRHGPLRQPVEVVDGAVDRVDDPHDAGGAVGGGALLPQEPVVRASGADAVDEQLLAGPVGLGDDVGGGRLRVVALEPGVHRQRQGPGPPGEVGGELEQRRRVGGAHGRSLPHAADRVGGAPGPVVR
jgi:hypothetical protein